MGKIAKPQRSNKHKKMKAIDPFYVGDRPVDRNAEKFNLKPRKGDEQEYSRSLSEILALKSDARLSKKKRKKKKTKQILDVDGFLDNLSPTERGVTRSIKAPPIFRRRKGESEETFLFRVDRETQAVIGQAQFEDKYQINEEVLVEKKSDKNEPLQTAKAKRKERLKTKRNKLKERHLSKLKDRNFDNFKDTVKFGEVVQQPPVLTVKPRKAAQMDSDKIGSRKLLLSNLNHHSPMEVTEETRHKKAERQIGKTVKSRNLAPSVRQAIDRERERTIELYRKLKQSKTAAVL